jgi:hypothetical protein
MTTLNCPTPHGSGEPPLTVPLAINPDLGLVERLVHRAGRLSPYDNTRFLEDLYQRLGAATVGVKKPPTEIPLVEDDLRRIKEAVRSLSEYHHADHELAEEGRLLLRRLFVGLGRARALRHVDDLPVYPAPAALPPTSTAPYGR